MVIFTKKEKQRIHKNIQAKNAFLGFGREGLANNVNYRYSESLANSFVKKILHNLKLPALKNKKKTLFSFFKEIHYNLFTVSYILFNMKTTVRDTRTKPYLPYFGVNFLSSILPYFHGYPTIKKKIRGSNPIYFSSMKSYTGFLFEDILKSTLNLNNTSHLLLILKNGNFFFDRKKIIYPTVDTVTKRFLSEFSKIED